MPGSEIPASRRSYSVIVTVQLPNGKSAGKARTVAPGVPPAPVEQAASAIAATTEATVPVRPGMASYLLAPARVARSVSPDSRPFWMNPIAPLAEILWP